MSLIDRIFFGGGFGGRWVMGCTRTCYIRGKASFRHILLNPDKYPSLDITYHLGRGAGGAPLGGFMFIQHIRYYSS